MFARASIALIFAAAVLLCTAAAMVFGISRERVGVAAELARLDQQLSSELTQSVRLVSLLSGHKTVREVMDLADPSLSDNDALHRLAIETARTAIIVSDPDGRILATGFRNPEGAPLATNLPEELVSFLSSNLLSRRFVFTDRDGWLFETGKGFYGPNNTHLGYVVTFQPLEDFAQTWNALTSNLNLKTADGRVLYENRRFVGTSWGPLRASSRSVVHGTVLEIEQSPRVLIGYGIAGFIVGLAILLAVLLARSNAARRRALTQARIEALSENAALLEAQVEQRTQELRDSHSELVQTAKLRVLDDMTIGLSHELSQPLFALEASLNTLECQLSEQPEAQRSLEKSQRVAHRMGQILNNLKSFARKDDEKPILLNLTEPVTAALEMLEHRTATHGATITHNIPEQPMVARATATRLQQVVVNILSNSLDAIAKDGTGIVQVDYVDGSKIKIADNGPGFADTKLARTPFSTTKADQNSLGLGLAISDRIMESFGGSLWLGSGQLGGATVTLNFDTEELE